MSAKPGLFLVRIKEKSMDIEVVRSCWVVSLCALLVQLWLTQLCICVPKSFPEDDDPVDDGPDVPHPNQKSKDLVHCSPVITDSSIYSPMLNI